MLPVRARETGIRVDLTAATIGESERDDGSGYAEFEFGAGRSTGNG